MITLHRERQAAGGDPSWREWAPRLAPLWLVGYGLLRLYWSLGHMPARMSPVSTDLVVFTGWRSVGLCAAAALVSTVLWKAPPSPRRGLLVLGWAASAGLVVSSPLFLLDVVGALAPGLGIQFFLVGSLSRAACLTAGVLVGLSTLSYQRRTRVGCVRCGRDGEVERMERVPPWAYWAAYLSVAGCLGRIVAQACVGFDQSPLRVAAALEFEAGFLLAGTLLPTALVHSFGRVWPRWVPFLAGRRVPRRLVLWPGVAISGGLVTYFGLMLLQMFWERLNGRNPFPPSDAPKGHELNLPESFFWAAVPAYFIWGAGLALAALAYHRLTRPPCKTCGR